jgi:site-specific recombinase XerD
MQHRTSLSHLSKFLETQHKVMHLSMIEALHLHAWLVFLAKEPGIRGKSRIPRTTHTCRWYAQSMHAFCNWLMAEQYLEENPAERVELPKLEKPLIRIIEFEEFEKLLAACAAPQEKGFSAVRTSRFTVSRCCSSACAVVLASRGSASALTSSGTPSRCAT